MASESSVAPTVALISQQNPEIPPTKEVRKVFLRQALRLTRFTDPFYPMCHAMADPDSYSQQMKRADQAVPCAILCHLAGEASEMAMDPDLWRRNIKEDLAWIADETHQREIWFPGSGTWNFPDEVLNWLDDHAFSDFVKSPTVNLSSAQREKAEKFWQEWQRFLQGSPESIGFELVDDPRWARIRILAKDLHDIL